MVSFLSAIVGNLFGWLTKLEIYFELDKLLLKVSYIHKLIQLKLILSAKAKCISEPVKQERSSVQRSFAYKMRALVGDHSLGV